MFKLERQFGKEDALNCVASNEFKMLKIMAISKNAIDDAIVGHTQVKA